MVGVSDVEEVATIGAKIARKLKPPPDEDPGVNAWRNFMASIITFTCALSIIHMFLDMGWVPGVDTKQTYEKDLIVLRGEFDAFRVQQLDSRIYNLRIRQCDALAHSESARLYSYQLSGLLLEFRQRAGRDYPMQTCAELELTPADIRAAKDADDPPSPKRRKGS